MICRTILNCFLLFNSSLFFSFCLLYRYIYSQLAMINIHTRLATLSQRSRLSYKNNNKDNCKSTGNSESGRGGDSGGGGVLNFRRPLSNPGGGLYKHLDDVRPVLQVCTYICAYVQVLCV